MKVESDQKEHAASIAKQRLNNMAVRKLQAGGGKKEAMKAQGRNQ
jgi:hypothetical protein